MSKNAKLITLSFLASLMIYPISMYAYSATTEDDALELSGNAANFFLDYIIPIAGFENVKKTDYRVFYGKDNGDSIIVHTESPMINKDNFYDNEDSPKIPEQTRKILLDIYCRSIEHKAILPSSKEGVFRQARELGKIIQLSYYDASKQSLLFSIGVSPKSCDSVNASQGQPD